jgi:hypothetical protein
MEPLSRQQWHRTPDKKDTPLVIILFVDAKPGTEQHFREVYHAAMPQFRGEPGVINYQLSQLEEDYGYMIGDFMKNPNLWAKLVIAKDKHIVERIISKIPFGIPFTFSYRICRKDGCIHWLETKITPTLNEQGSVIRIDGFTSDITMRKEALNLLFVNEQKLNTRVQEFLGAKILEYRE